MIPEILLLQGAQLHDANTSVSGPGTLPVTFASSSHGSRTSLPRPEEKCHFWRLPRELRDEIFQLAYSTDLVQCYGASPYAFYTQGYYGDHLAKVSPKTLVCKTWHFEAYLWYLRCNIFSFYDADVLARVVKGDLSGMIKDNIQYVIVDWASKELEYCDQRGCSICQHLRPGHVLSQCRRLKALAVGIDYIQHQSVPKQTPHLRLPMDFDIMAHDLQQLRGLSLFSTHWSAKSSPCFIRRPFPRFHELIQKFDKDVREVAVAACNRGVGAGSSFVQRVEHLKYFRTIVAVRTWQMRRSMIA